MVYSGLEVESCWCVPWFVIRPSCIMAMVSKAPRSVCAFAREGGRDVGRDGGIEGGRDGWREEGRGTKGGSE